MRDHYTDPVPNDGRVIIRVPEDVDRYEWVAEDDKYRPSSGWYDPRVFDGVTGWVFSWYPNGTDTPGGPVEGPAYWIMFDEEVKIGEEWWKGEWDRDIITKGQFLDPEWVEAI